MVRVSIIIPAYNEGKRIESTLKSLLKTFEKNAEILVVSNGSKDDTIKILEEWRKNESSIDYLNFPKKLGKGGAIIEGLKVVKGEYIGFVDADDAFDLEYIKRSFHKFSNFDCLIASKWKGKNLLQVNEPFMRKIMSRGWNVLVRVFLGLPYRDTQAGAKFFKKEVRDKMDFNFISNGFAFDVELLTKIKKNNFRIEEVYIPSRFVEGSTFNLKYCPGMFKDLIRIWWSR